MASATKYLGVPYVWGGTNPAVGLDCSGLVQLVAKQNGVSLPRVAVDQGKVGQLVPSIDQAKPGDLLLTRNGGHIAIYAGDGKIIHAPRPGKKVELVPVSYAGPIVSIRRILPTGTAPVVNAAGVGAAGAQNVTAQASQAAMLAALASLSDGGGQAASSSSAAVLNALTSQSLGANAGNLLGNAGGYSGVAGSAYTSAAFAAGN